VAASLEKCWRAESGAFKDGLSSGSRVPWEGSRKGGSTGTGGALETGLRLSDLLLGSNDFRDPELPSWSGEPPTLRDRNLSTVRLKDCRMRAAKSNHRQR